VGRLPAAGARRAAAASRGRYSHGGGLSPRTPTPDRAPGGGSRWTTGHDAGLSGPVGQQGGAARPGRDVALRSHRLGSVFRTPPSGRAIFQIGTARSRRTRSPGRQPGLVRVLPHPRHARAAARSRTTTPPRLRVVLGRGGAGHGWKLGRRAPRSYRTPRPRRGQAQGPNSARVPSLARAEEFRCGQVRLQLDRSMRRAWTRRIVRDEESKWSRWVRSLAAAGEYRPLARSAPSWVATEYRPLAAALTRPRSFSPSPRTSRRPFANPRLRVVLGRGGLATEARAPFAAVVSLPPRPRRGRAQGPE
jgi:hypothetical protein